MRRPDEFACRHRRYAASVESLQGKHAIDDIGAAAYATIFAGAAAAALGGAEWVSLRKQRRGDGSFPQHSVLRAGEKQPRESRMGRDIGQL